jgi:hypothetical protein
MSVCLCAFSYVSCPVFIVRGEGSSSTTVISSLHTLSQAHTHARTNTHSHTRTYMASPLSTLVADSFRSAEAENGEPDNESAFYRSYLRLLHDLVPTTCDLAPQWVVPGTRGTIDFVVLYRGSPVLLLEVKPPSHFHRDSKRQMADKQVRQRFVRLHSMAVTPCLHAISALGTQISFYTYTVSASTTTPSAIPPHSSFHTDVVPSERWSYNVLEQEGTTSYAKQHH